MASLSVDGFSDADFGTVQGNALHHTDTLDELFLGGRPATNEAANKFGSFPGCIGIVSIQGSEFERLTIAKPHSLHGKAKENPTC